MSNWFTRLFTHDSSHDDGYSQPQREALLDLLVFCMCADRRIEFSEQDFLHHQMERYAWSAQETVDEFVKASRIRADKAHASDEDRAAYSKDIGSRLASDDLRTKAIALSRRMFKVDHDYAKPEVKSYDIIFNAIGSAG